MVGTGTVLKNRWKLSKKIGQGVFGEIYNGTDTTTQDPVAVKLERWDSCPSVDRLAVLKMEVAVLKKLQHCQYACRYVSPSSLLPPRRPSRVFSLRWVRHGNNSSLSPTRPQVHCGHFEDHSYLVMELLGENLSELRRRRPGGRFSLWTTVRLGIQMMRAVEVRRKERGGGMCGDR
jgi:tau tubulin kinase